MRRLFITAEGIDGSGKTDVVRTISSILRWGAEGPAGTGPQYPVYETYEPSSNTVGRLIRRALRGEITIAREAMGPLFAADRADHVARDIAPALARGDVVVCDRYDLSNVAYRAAEAGGPLFVCNECCYGTDDIADNHHVSAGIGVWWKCPACYEHEFGHVHHSDAVASRIKWASHLLDPPAPTPDLTLVLDVPLSVASDRRRARGGADELYDDAPTQARLRSLYRAMPSLYPDRRIVIVDAASDPDTVVARCMAHVAPLLV